MECPEETSDSLAVPGELSNLKPVPSVAATAGF